MGTDGSKNPLQVSPVSQTLIPEEKRYFIGLIVLMIKIITIKAHCRDLCFPH